jgi:hypothetical protein
MKKILISSLIIGFLGLSFYLTFAQNFLGPSCAPGQCQGRIRVDSNGNISIGTSTLESITRAYVVASTSDSSAYALKILASNSSPLLLVRNDGKISIATSSFTSTLTVQGDIYASGNITMGGNLSAPISAGNVTPGVFNSLQGGGTGAYAFLGNLGIVTSSQVGLPQALSVYGGGYFSGNVGIGTITPYDKLHVYGGGLRISNGAFGANGFVFEQDGTSGNLNIRYKNPTSTSAEIMSLGYAGNVGIGTTGPNDKLDVAGNLRVLTGSNPIRFTASWTAFPDAATNQAEISNDTGSYKTLMIVGNKSNDGSTRRVSVWDRLEVNGNFITTGNVGIGTTTPAYKLDVQGGQINTSGGLCIAGDCKTAWSQVGGAWITATGGIYYNNGNVAIGTSTVSASLPLYIETSSTLYTGIGLSNTNVSSRIWSIFANSNGTTYGPSKGFGVRDVSAGVTRLVIDTSGNVGIGTTAPGYTLDVNGNIRGRGDLYITKGFSPFIGTTDNFDLRLGVNTAEYMRITTGGNVGIGTTGPSYKLDVVSGGGTTARFGTASSDTVTIGNGAGKINVGTVDPIYTINGKKYATYGPESIGIKVNHSDLIKLTRNGKYFEASLDFKNAKEGSDLWLFSKTTNLVKNFDKLSIQLTPSFIGKVWYNKDKENMIVKIYAISDLEENNELEVSYTLTAPRFDSDKWTNYSNDDVDGFIIND